MEKSDQGKNNRTQSLPWLICDPESTDFWGTSVFPSTPLLVLSHQLPFRFFVTFCSPRYVAILVLNQQEGCHPHCRNCHYFVHVPLKCPKCSLCLAHIEELNVDKWLWKRKCALIPVSSAAILVWSDEKKNCHNILANNHKIQVINFCFFGWLTVLDCCAQQFMLPNNSVPCMDIIWTPGNSFRMI